MFVQHLPRAVPALSTLHNTVLSQKCEEGASSPIRSPSWAASGGGGGLGSATTRSATALLAGPPVARTECPHAYRGEARLVWHRLHTAGREWSGAGEGSEVAEGGPTGPRRGQDQSHSTKTSLIAWPCELWDKPSFWHFQLSMKEN